MMASGQRRYEQLVVALEGGGHRPTPQGEAVPWVVAHSDHHPSVEQVYAQARERCRSTSRATVYNAVAVLKQLGESVELEFAGAGNRYDARSVEPHAHLVCTHCGRIDDYDLADLRQ